MSASTAPPPSRSRTSSWIASRLSGASQRGQQKAVLDRARRPARPARPPCGRIGHKPAGLREEPHRGDAGDRDGRDLFRRAHAHASSSAAGRVDCGDASFEADEAAHARDGLLRVAGLAGQLQCAPARGRHHDAVGRLAPIRRACDRSNVIQANGQRPRRQEAPPRSNHA